ncbi:MAG: EamA family transporter [Pseudomonadota bacterium]
MRSWTCLLIIGLLHTGVVYELMYSAFQRLRADMIATLSFIYPLVAVSVDLGYFHSRLSDVQMVGMAMILLSVIASQRSAATSGVARWWKTAPRSTETTILLPDK